MWFTKLKVTDDWAWLGFSFSILIFPLFPALGALGIVIVSSLIWQSNYSRIIRSPLNQGLGVLTILLIISSSLAQYPTEAWLGLANFLPFFAIFVALRYLITKPEQLRQLSWLLIVPTLPIVILGLGQLFAAWDSPQLIESILGWRLIPLGVPAGRMSSVFIYTNFLGLILTSSRNAWGLAVFSFMAYAVFMGWRWLVWGVTGATTAILWASFAPNLGGTQLRQIVPNFIWTRLSDQLYERPVETLRITQWQFCWDLIRERPLHGWGLRNFTPLYEAKKNFWFGHPHNLFLMLGAETGIVPTLLLIILVGSIMWRASKLLLSCSNNDSQLIFYSYAIAFSCYILFNLADVTIFDLRVNTIAWILLGAISGVSKPRSV